MAAESGGRPLRFGVIVYPGSNNDHDTYYVLKSILGQDARLIWHKDTSLQDADVVVLPGGFSYGDYLRCGAIARFSPVTREIVSFARDGGVVLGICNGFQILCEAGLLPGVLLRNASLNFVCRTVNVRVDNASTVFTADCREGQILRMPVAHGEGNYFADEATLTALESNGRILFRYCEDDGSLSGRANPNGSVRNIAGIMNEAGNVMGLMPHPERVSDPVLGNTDGQWIFRSVIKQVQDHVVAERS